MGEYEVIIEEYISTCYRIIITIYSLILLFFYTNYFSIYIYAICIFLSIIYPHKKRKIMMNQEFVKWSPAIDYLLIGVILFGKPMNELQCIIFLFLPIFNIPNFGGIKRSYAILFIPPIVIYIFYLEQVFSFFSLIPFLAVAAISIFEYFRTRANNFYYGLINSITEFYASKKEATYEYKVYSDIIARFNVTKFSKLCYLTSIHCISVSKAGFYLKNSSDLASVIDITDQDYFFQRLMDQEVFSDNGISLNGKLMEFTFIIPLIHAEENIAYIMVGTKQSHSLNLFPSFRNKLFLNPFLIPFFEHLSEFFSHENLHKENRNKKFRQISDEHDYVLRTISAVHFIRTRLSPYLNYLEMTNDLYHNRNYNPEIRMALEKVIVEENDRSRSALKEVLERSDQILDSTNNPFNVRKDIKAIEVLNIVSDLQNLMRDILGTIGSDRLKVQLLIEDYEKLLMVSTKGMNIVFSDVIGNIRKHSDGQYNVDIKIENTKLLITFTNSVEITPTRLHDLRFFCQYISSDENYDIFKMSTKGAFIMKDFLRQMDVKFLVTFDQKNRSFTTELIFNLVSP